MKKFKIQSYDPNLCRDCVVAESPEEALYKVLGHYNGDQGFTVALEINSNVC